MRYEAAVRIQSGIHDLLSLTRRARFRRRVSISSGAMNRALVAQGLFFDPAGSSNEPATRVCVKTVLVIPRSRRRRGILKGPRQIKHCRGYHCKARFLAEFILSPFTLFRAVRDWRANGLGMTQFQNVFQNLARGAISPHPFHWVPSAETAFPAPAVRHPGRPGQRQ